MKRKIQVLRPIKKVELMNTLESMMQIIDSFIDADTRDIMCGAMVGQACICGRHAAPIRFEDTAPIIYKVVKITANGFSTDKQ